jgi:hypothetical protein
MPRKTAPFALALALFASLSAAAFDLDWIAFRFGGGILLNLDDVGGPSPPYTSIGAQLSFSFGKDSSLAVEPSVDATLFYYEWVAGRAVPTELENREATVIALAIDVPLLIRLTLAPGLGLSTGAGVAAMGFFGFLSDPYASQESVDSINAWLFNPARIFAATFHVRIDLAMTETASLGVSARWALPFLGWLDPSSPSFFDRSSFDLALSLRFPIR